MPSLFLLLGRWSFCCSSPHFRGTEVVMEFMREFAHKFVDEFFANFVHEFKYEIRTNSYEFLVRKIGYVTNGLYCM